MDKILSLIIEAKTNWSLADYGQGTACYTQKSFLSSYNPFLSEEHQG
jgi:hypothetical protein